MDLVYHGDISNIWQSYGAYLQILILLPELLVLVLQLIAKFSHVIVLLYC